MSFNYITDISSATTTEVVAQIYNLLLTMFITYIAFNVLNKLSQYIRGLR